MLSQYRKFLRFISIYGVKRAAAKALGRIRINMPVTWIISPLKIVKQSSKNVAMVGCGQFAFATVGFFVVKNKGPIFKFGIDIDEKSVDSFSNAYRCEPILVSADNIELPALEGIQLAYIASNHYSHTEYACQLLNRGIDVYIEKPISVNWAQLEKLERLYEQSANNIYFGYNRPFSKAIKQLSSRMSTDAFTMTCTIVGHQIPEEHWYRNPNEGTRVCGNLGHWLDLSVHLLMHKKILNYIEISILQSDTSQIDDNLVVSMASDQGDLMSIVLTAREEPYEGINESIIFQQNNLFVKIDDFRKAEFQYGHKKEVKRYKPKDVGHEGAIMQPFSIPKRDSKEVFLSTRLMLHVLDMVKNSNLQTTFYCAS